MQNKVSIIASFRLVASPVTSSLAEDPVLLRVEKANIPRDYSAVAGYRGDNRMYCTSARSS